MMKVLVQNIRISHVLLYKIASAVTNKACRMGGWVNHKLLKEFKLQFLRFCNKNLIIMCL